MSYIMDTIFGDGSEGSGTPDPLKTVGSFFNAGITFGAGLAILDLGAEIGSNSLAGGVNLSTGTAGAAMNADISYSPLAM